MYLQSGGIDKQILTRTYFLRVLFQCRRLRISSPGSAPAPVPWGGHFPTAPDLLFIPIHPPATGANGTGGLRGLRAPPRLVALTRTIYKAAHRGLPAGSPCALFFLKR